MSDYRRENTPQFDNEQLAHQLWRMGIRFVGVADETRLYPTLLPVQLICGLATSEEARLRLALIPLFLLKPEVVAYTRLALSRLPEKKHLLLKVYYTAARLIQEKYQAQFRVKLDDLFDNEFHIIPNISVEEKLTTLAKYHAEQSCEPINWLGTYNYAAIRTLKLFESQIHAQFECPNDL